MEISCDLRVCSNLLTEISTTPPKRNFGNTMMKKTTATAIVLASLASFGLVGTALGAAVATSTFSTLVHVSASLTASGCDNSPGPNITLQGALSLGKVGVQLLFENNLKGTHTLTVQSTASATVIPEGQTVQIPKQPVLGGVGGNPFIWMQFVNTNNNPLTDPVFLGRCVQGLFNTASDFSIPATATALVSADSCSNTGSDISLSGQIALTGIKANLIFANNDNPVGGPHRNTQPATVSVVIIPAGQTITFAKQPPLGGVGGNPWIFLAFTDGQGQPVSSQFPLGRCVQLG